MVKPPSVRRSGGNTGFFQLLLVGLLLVTLLGNGNASRNDVVGNTKAEATFTDFMTDPGVRVSWRIDAFVRGNNQKEGINIYRSDVIDTPVAAVSGTQSSFTDTPNNRTITYLNPGGLQPFVCNGQPGGSSATPPNLVPGRPYVYQTELIYSINGLDFPSQPAPFPKCFFASERDTAPGPATPLERPDLVSPVQSAVFDTADELNAPRFTFESVVEPTFPITVQYALQMSPSPQFPKGQTETMGVFVSNSSSRLSIAPGPFNRRASFLRNAKTIWWRIGARNIDDKPGPVPDASGQRYIFSTPRSFTVVRDDVPPPP